MRKKDRERKYVENARLAVGFVPEMKTPTKCGKVWMGRIDFR